MGKLRRTIKARAPRVNRAAILPCGHGVAARRPRKEIHEVTATLSRLGLLAGVTPGNAVVAAIVLIDLFEGRIDANGVWLG